jgi:drug/metabolite transporter (DMT)-like permease
VFVGIFSVLFLNRRLMVREWGGIFLVIGGLALVGVSDFVAPSTPAELTSTSASASNHSTGQIILGMSSTFQIKHDVAVIILAYCAGDPELKLMVQISYHD